MKDNDVNCRLRHGLNAYCMAHIFKYLDSDDLYILGGMNQVYGQIIIDLVIPTHEVHFDSLLLRRGISILQMFERYGKNIRRISLQDHDGNQTTEQLLQSITQFCSADQLKSVKIYRAHRTRDRIHINLPNRFRNVETLDLRRLAPWQISVQLSDALRELTLVDIDLEPNFDWNRLRNLKKLHLRRVNGINVQHFIDLLDIHRPKIEYFHHGELNQLSGGTIQHLCAAVAMYCGNQIRYYSGQMPPPREVGTALGRRPYDFISSFKNVTNVCLTSYQLCGGDLIDALKRLAENDTIRTLKIMFYDAQRIFWQRSNDVSRDMKNFSNLKTIEIFAPHSAPVRGGCDPFGLFIVYSPQILLNVENLIIECAAKSDLDFLQCMPKLRYLDLNVDRIELDHVTKIHEYLENILRNRSNAGGDFIEIKFHHIHDYELFRGIEGRNDSIKLTLLDYLMVD